MSVAYTKTGDGFAIEVRESDRALDVFHHSVAHAAWRGIDTGSPRQDASPVERLTA